MLTNIIVWSFLSSLIFAAGLFGRFENVPQEARDAAVSGLKSHIVNGLNFQSRIDVRLVEIKNGDPKKILLPVDREYSFQAQNLASGEYELSVHAYDFSVPVPRYRIVINDDVVEAFADDLAAASYNVSSKHTVSRESPLNIEVSGFKNYYESAGGKLTEMVMNSPLGVIFRSKIYSALFFGTLVIIAFPYIIPYVAPNFAEEYQKVQQEYNGQPENTEKISETTDERSSEKVSAIREARKSKAKRR